ncbi:pilus assembly PilX N-terminal domain-containing protein [Candidatus Parcubacteria bacterium]|nr:pilus assembly PilX N-terminal domain-containing protein [Candidatus Parcubacteria bacterium]
MKNQRKNQRGFTLLIAIVITATLLLVSTGIVSVAVKEAILASAGRESQFAFYAADTGIECAIYWDVKNPSGLSAFSTTTTSTINCNSDSVNTQGGKTNPTPNQVGGASGISVFSLTFLPDPYCATVTVTKTPDLRTTIESLGYNTCAPGNARRVERAVRVRY